ncbi:MAG: FixH family protein [Pseudomonadales bacterium]|nr:FixH family protein [Pseudomonadales bacterium]
MSITAGKTIPWYRQGWPWFLILLPATVVVACFITLYLAISHQDPLVQDDYYKEGLAINRELARADYAREHGIAGELNFDPGTLAVELHVANVLPTPPILRLEILHPTDQARDQVLTLHHSVDNVFIGKAASLLDGRFYLLLEPAPDEARSWRLRGTLVAGLNGTATARLGAD